MSLTLFYILFLSHWCKILENAFKSKNMSKFFQYALNMTLWADTAAINTKFELM